MTQKIDPSFRDHSSVYTTVKFSLSKRILILFGYSVTIRTRTELTPSPNGLFLLSKVKETRMDLFPPRWLRWH